MGNAVMQIGTDEFYMGKPDANGYNDAFPTMPLLSSAIRNLAETRMAALKGSSLEHPLTWNDVMFAHRSVFGRNGNELGNFADLPRRVPNLLAAYSPSASLRYTNGQGTVQGTTDTDSTGRTVTAPNSQVIDTVRMQAAAGPSTVTLPTGATDNLVWVVLHHAEPTAGQSPIFSCRRTAATDFLVSSEQMLRLSLLLVLLPLLRLRSALLQFLILSLLATLLMLSALMVLSAVSMLTEPVTTNGP